MPDYRRWYVPGGTYFFTLVAQDRRSIFNDNRGRSCLRSAFRHVRRRRPFQTIAIVVLPDHLHVIWQLPRGDDGFSIRLGLFKEQFTRRFLADGGTEGSRSDSRARRRERGVWQRRFWEHLCRNEDDLSEKVNYIHWNPVKHGLVRHVADYRWSSFRRFVRLGHYPKEWGGADEARRFDHWEWE
jgi:putative transposase